MVFPALTTPKKPDIPALRDQRKIDALIRALQHPDFDIQWQAAEALGKLGPEAVDHLLAALKHHERDVRLGIIEALGEIRDSRSVPALLNLLKDESSEVRWATALALGEIGDLRAQHALVLSLLDPDKYVRYGAALSLESLGWHPRTVHEKVYHSVGKQEWDPILELGPEAIDPILPLLRDKDPEVRARVLEILGSLGGEKAQRYCKSAMADPDTSVRWSAVTSGLKCGVSHTQIPLGVSKRSRGEKNPYIAGFLNFLFPGIGYGYSVGWGWFGFAIWQTYLLVLLCIILFVNNLNYILPTPFYVFYPAFSWASLPTWKTGANIAIYTISIGMAVHVWHRVRTRPYVL